jgi:hypothetical protein
MKETNHKNSWEKDERDRAIRIVDLAGTPITSSFSLLLDKVAFPIGIFKPRRQRLYAIPKIGYSQTFPLRRVYGVINYKTVLLIIGQHRINYIPQ